MRITCDDGATGTGYSYTIGTGGSSVVALLRDHLAPLLIGEDASEVERLWKKLFFRTHATAVGAITSLALAAIDTALWDLRCRRAGLPLWKMAGGAQRAGPDVHDRGRLAAPVARRARRADAGGARRGVPRREAQGRQAPRVGRRRPARGRARRGRRRVRDHDRREPGVHRVGIAAAGARLRAVRARVARGTAARRGPGRPRRARAGRPDADRGRRIALYRCSTSGNTSSATRARSCRSTARGSAA